MQTRQKVEQVKVYVSAVENPHNPLHEAVKVARQQTGTGQVMGGSSRSRMLIVHFLIVYSYCILCCNIFFLYTFLQYIQIVHFVIVYSYCLLSYRNVGNYLWKPTFS